MADAPRRRYAIDAFAHAQTRQLALTWAIQGAAKGADPSAILEVADSYLSFILEPLLVEEVEFAAAIAARDAASLH